MLRRRAATAGIMAPIGKRICQATGITAQGRPLLRAVLRGAFLTGAFLTGPTTIIPAMLSSPKNREA